MASSSLYLQKIHGTGAIQRRPVIADKSEMCWPDLEWCRCRRLSAFQPTKFVHQGRLAGARGSQHNNASGHPDPPCNFVVGCLPSAVLTAVAVRRFESEAYIILAPCHRFAGAAKSIAPGLTTTLRCCAGVWWTAPLMCGEIGDSRTRRSRPWQAASTR